MLIYHGTSAEYLPDILKNGLRPRGETAGQWEEFPSRTDCVYLTTAYPFFFAMSCPVETTDRVVLEIDTDKLDQSLLMADEDFIAQMLNQAQGDEKEKTLAEIHEYVREHLEEFEVEESDGAIKVGNIRGECNSDDPAWKHSVKWLTTCCYRGTIPPSAFVRYCLFDYSKRPLISAMSYNEGPHLKGPHEQHRHLTEWFFADRKKLPHFKPERFVKTILKERELVEQLLNPDWKKEEHWRGGINVCDYDSVAAEQMPFENCFLCKMTPYDPLHAKTHPRKVQEHIAYVRSIYHSKGMPEPNCQDCGVNTLGDEYYWVLPGVWEESKAESFLCVGCLEKRIGRESKPDDFQWGLAQCVVVNCDPRYPKSERLKSRMGEKCQYQAMYLQGLLEMQK